MEVVVESAELKKILKGYIVVSNVSNKNIKINDLRDYLMKNNDIKNNITTKFIIEI